MYPFWLNSIGGTSFDGIAPLLIVQFGASMFLITSLLIVNTQLDYMQPVTVNPVEQLKNE